MTDGVAITAGSGTTIATDDAGAGGQVQIVKLAIATDGSATPIPADASGILVKSATAANMLVTEASAAAILTSTQLVDDIVYVDDTATHSTGTSKGALMMAAAAPTDAAVDVNDIGAVAMTTSRRLHVSVQDATFAGTAATNLGKTEDLAHASGHVGIMALAVREAAATDLSAGNTDGDYEPLQVDATGRVWVRNVNLTPAGDTMTDDTNDALRVTIVTGVQSAGVVATSGLAINKAGGQITSATTTTLVSSTGGQVIQVIALILYNGALANNLTFQDSTGPTNLIGSSAVINLAANQGLVLDPKSSGWFNATGSGESLDLVTSSNGPLTWYLEYTKG